MKNIAHRSIVARMQCCGFMNFVTLRLCVTKTLIFLLSLILVSCSPYKRLAYDFVKKSKGASVALYVPSELLKTNKRADCDPNNIDLVLLEEDQLQDTINSRIKILNKIDDEIFLDVLFASFEETLSDYDLSLTYWEDDNKKPDSLHWIVDLSHIEIQEQTGVQVLNCGLEGNYEFIPLTTINVASWFELINDEESNLVFSEQNYEDYVVDCYYTMDSIHNLITNVEFQNISIDGFYNFAVALGKLYAGYCYDFFMNEYVSKEMKKVGKAYSFDEKCMRYDPYEYYIYSTWTDKMVRMEN